MNLSKKLLALALFFSFFLLFSIGFAAVTGCWNFGTNVTCSAVGGCQWHAQPSYGWCEEKGCWNYYNESSCNVANCTWENSTWGGGWCYKKTCWNYNSTTCPGNCNWTGYGYCTKPNCWDYKDSSSCGSTTDNLTCKWDSSYGYCSGDSSKSCWNYNDQIGCQGASCTWTSGTCSEVGCWSYYDQGNCTDTTLHLNANCAWGSQGSSGYCKENMTTCWNIYTKDTCSSNPKCSWSGSEYCTQKSCWLYNTNATCTDSSLHPSLNCEWNFNYSYCNEITCWSYMTNATCSNTTAHPNLTCTWDGSYCSKTSCWNLNTNATCTASANPVCSWNSQWSYCEEPGCWNYAANATCSAASSLGCSWKTYGYCNQIYCSNYYNESTCIAHASDDCRWNSTYSYCTNYGCWSLNTNETCSNATDTYDCTWDGTYNYCSDKGCWSYSNQSSCDAASTYGCTWSLSGSYCYKPYCWNYYSQDGCMATNDTLNCNWTINSYCQKTGCYDYTTNNTCAADNTCNWYSWGSCSEKGCWSYNTKTDCDAHALSDMCKWDSTYSYCQEYGCWNYNNQTNCTAVPNCLWNNQSNYCYEPNCWNYYDQTNCDNSTLHSTINCTWESYNYCYQVGCWNYNNNNSCLNSSDTLNCNWKTSGWCGSFNSTGTNCWNYWTNDTCLASPGCNWTQSTWCEELGPWNYNTQSTCVGAGFNWSSSGGYCSEPTTLSCWNYDYNETGCTAMNATCKWQSPYCTKKGCWEYTNQSSCNLTSADLSCSWATATSSGWCEEVGCWNFFNNQTQCQGSGLNCEWKEYGWCNVNCWNYTNSTGCGNNSRCRWVTNVGSSWCDMKGCWNYWNQSGCVNNTDRMNCTWNEIYNYCSEVGCWAYPNTTACRDAGCIWDSTGLGWCTNEGCWVYHDSDSCTAKNCSWSTNSYCEERRCWMFNQSTCGNATALYNLSCSWQNGYCGESMTGCSQYSNNETGCKNSGYCWWNVNGTCEEPSNTWINQFEQDKMNPGCWIFDNQKTKCQNVTGCGWSANSSQCVGLESGIQCGNISSSTLCSKIPVLASCCKWQNNTCQADTVSAKCFENMQPSPEGATYCEDYNSYTDQTLCNQIAADPWYMPCKWDSMGTVDTSDDRCTFRSDEKFGTGGKDLGKIMSKKDCEFAGGIWKQEYYCENNKTVPYGWCEVKSGASGKSCDASCWACEYRPNGTMWNNATEAIGACKGSKLGYCNWTTNNTAPNGFGYCKMPDDIKFGKGDCNSDCKACEKKASPKTTCESSSANCKWVEDSAGTTTAGGWCYPQSEKSCSEDCFRCYDEVSCVNYGKGTKGSCVWDENIKLCKPKNFDKEICFDGTDDDGDGKTDCEDVDCYSDPFCGAGMVSDCWKYTTQTICANHSSENCLWIIDSWAGKTWCGTKGENCFMWDGNPSGCANQSGLCQWYNDPKGGYCEINNTKIETCFKLTAEGSCKANSDCKWTFNPSTGTGTCEYKLVKCSSYGKSLCQNTTAYCSWIPDQLNASKGECTDKCDSSAYQIFSTCNSTTDCVWVSGFCDPASSLGMKSEDCWQYSDSYNCGLAKSCEWKSAGGSCDMNQTLMNNCMNIKNQTSCTGNCTWVADMSGNGYCDFILMRCHIYSNPADCNGDLGGVAAGNCAWVTKTMMGGSEFGFGGAGGGGFGIEGGPVGGGGAFTGTNMSTCEPRCFNYSTSNACLGNMPYCNWRLGFCEPKMAKQMFKGMESGEPVPLGMDTCPEAIDQPQDICGFGVRDMPDNFAFGTMVFSMKDSALCKGQQVLANQSTRTTISGSGTNTTKFYWYLDTDGIESGGCPLYNNASAVGYEFFLKYIAKWSDGELKETKTSYRCDDGDWVITDIKLSVWQNLVCEEIGGAMIAVDKDDLKKFQSLYKPEKKIRVYASTAGKTASEINPIDAIGPSYYSPGTVDFKFENCMISGVDMDNDGFTSENDPDCMKFQQMGFIMYEDCFASGNDEDSDGLVDCNDPDCKFAMNCAGTGVNAAGYNDTVAPGLKWYKVETYPDGAFVKYDTDEPANGTIQFYYNDSVCGTINKTLLDSGLLNNDSWDNYKNWHDGPIDNFAFNPQRLGYNLSNATTYYYKLKICDSSGNCGYSACLNFTTSNSRNRRDCPSCEFTVKFEGTNVKFDSGSGWADQGGGCGADAGMKFNYTSSTIDVKVEGTNGSIIFDNATLIGSLSILLNVTEGQSGGAGYVGMNSSVFDNLTTKLVPKYCIVQIPKGNNGTCTKVWHCQDDGSNCVDRTSESTLLNNTATYCEWKIPCDFSIWRTNSPTSNTTTTTTGGSGGGGGGGGAAGGTKKTWMTVVPGITNKMTLNDLTLVFKEIEFKSNKNLTDVTLTVTRLSSQPSSVTTPAGTVNQWIEITTLNITDADISSVSIKFNVTKSWLNTNGFTFDNVYLYRYSSGWTKMITSKIGESDTDIQYQSSSPGLSVFVVAAEKPAQPQQPTQPSGPVCGDGKCESSENINSCPSDCKPAEKPIEMPKTITEITTVVTQIWIDYWPGIIATVMVLIIILGWLYYHGHHHVKKFYYKYNKK
ncbi:MAG: PGF-pre-PGF domain-containing protein [Candidatus Aenigmatarchaeota archaeon]